MIPNIQHIQYFIESCRQQNIAKAARQLNISQSAISQAIRKLEESLGVELLVHGKKQFVLTSAGHKALPLFIKQMESFESIREQLKREDIETIKDLHLSTLRSLALAFFAEAITELKKEKPRWNSIINIGHTKDIVPDLLDNKLDLAVVVNNNRMFGVQKLHLHQGRFCLVVGKNYSSKVAELPFIATQESPGAKDLKKIIKVKAPKIWQGREVQFVESWEVIAKFASLGLGIGLVPDFVFKTHRHLELVEILPQLSKEITFEVSLITRPKEKDLQADQLQKIFSVVIKRNLNS